MIVRRAGAALLALCLVVGPAPSLAAPGDARARYDAAIAQVKTTMMIDPRKASAEAKAARALVDQLDPAARPAALAEAEWLQGEAALRLNDAAAAAEPIEDALRRVGPGPSKLRGDLLLSRGGLHLAQTKVAEALTDYQAAHNIFRDLGNTRSRSIALLYIAGLYQEAKDYRNALKYYAQASDVYGGDPVLMLSIRNNRGDALKELRRFAESEAEFRRGLVLARSMKSVSSQAMMLRNMARLHLVAGQVDAADRVIGEGRRLVGLDREDEAQFAALAAQIALERGQLRVAEEQITAAFDGADLTTTTLPLRDAHATAVAIYKKVGREALALAHLEALKRLDDQATGLAASTNTALASARFDYANQETRIANLKAAEAQRSADFERARATTQRQIFLGSAAVAVIVLALLSFGLVTIRRSRNQVRAANVDLAATNLALGKALAAKTEFLATTSHEIRTPLNGILGMTQVMLADRSLAPAMRDRIGVVHGAGTTMKALVDDILDVAKMETGHLTVEEAPVDLPALVQDACRLWAEQARGKGLAFALDVGTAPAWICGDAARLRQVLFNLLSNALKFTEKGRVCVRASAADGRLRLSVSDSGIGIAADKQELIFESFKQADGGTTRKYGGTGLGLAICRNLARAMGGDILVESRDGEGATFTLDLPLVLAEPPEAVVPCSPHEGAPCGLLIVDRSPITRAMLKTVLEPRAGTVRVAGSVEEAEAEIARGNLTHVLLDEATMKATGDVAAGVARIAAAAGDTVRIAQLWTAPDIAQVEALERAGATAIIAKPIAGNALADALFDRRTIDSDAEHLVTRAA